MNIYEFFHSPDIAEHCRQIGHSFSPLDMTAIIYLSEKPIRQKHEAYRYIIAECPDMAIHKSLNFAPRESLHEYLRELIAYENRGIEKLTSAESGVVFRAAVRSYDEHDYEYVGCDLDECFSTFERAKEAVYSQWNWDEDKIKDARVEKITVDAEHQRRFVTIDRNGEIINLDYYEENEPDLPDMLFFHLPLPFEKGDLVTFGGNKPFVLKWLPHWLDNDRRKYGDYLEGKRGDGSDMNAMVYFMDSDELSADNGPPYMTWKMQHFRGELKGRERFLKHLGKYLQENDDGLDWLVAVYMKYYTEAQNERWNKLFGGWFVALDEEMAK